MASSFSETSPIGLVIFGMMSALVYYMLRKISTNKLVVIAIGVALMLFTTGSLEKIGLGVTALGVSRLVEEGIVKLESSERR